MDLFRFFLLLLFSKSLKACLYHKPKVKPIDEYAIPGPWTEKTYKRKEEPGCECGSAVDQFNVGSPIWHLFIHVIRDDNDNEINDTVCTGTIITSNLIATSHDCLHRKGKAINVYDAWDVRVRGEGLLKKEAIRVSSSINHNESEGETFNVTQIILSSHFLMRYNIKRKNMSELNSDVLLLKLNADFTNATSDHRPICLPRDEDDMDFTSQLGYYYGAEMVPVSGHARSKSNSSGLACGEGGDKEPPIYNRTHEGIILTRAMCEMEHFNGTIDWTTPKDLGVTLCLRWNNQIGISPPNIPGGPLLLKSGKKSTLFLIGIAFDITSHINGFGTDYAYFTNILRVIKYIERHAEKQGSKWCKTPQLKLPQKIPQSPDETKRGPWPWESKDFCAHRKEIACVCGLQNPVIQGRIVGGVEATAHEFGWMTVIKLHHFGQGGGTNFCGGSIINDRMILTAAHCVVHNDKLKSSKNPIIDYHNVEVFINAHKRQDDEDAVKVEVQAVLVHPEYAIAMKKGAYFDYDIALLVLKETLVFPPAQTELRISPICLPRIGEQWNLMHQKVTAAGWGLMDPTSQRSAATKLQKIELPIIELSKCRGVALSLVTDRNLCAGSLNRFKDAASGDSGGPLMIRKGNQWYEVGIVSWGEDVTNSRTGEIQTAALYTHVTHKLILPFIDYHAKRLGVNWCKSQE